MDARSGRSGGLPDQGRASFWLGPALAAAALLLAAPGCAGPNRSDPPVPEDVYVEVMARLAAVRTATDPREVAPPMPDERADSIRSHVLNEYDISDSDLKEFARVIGDEPARMKTLWERIASVSDSLWRAGWPPLSENQRPRGGRR